MTGPRPDHPLATGLGDKARATGLDDPQVWTARAAAKVREVVFPANARLAAKLGSLREEAVAETESQSARL